jgi:hypothetical protein
MLETSKEAYFNGMTALVFKSTRNLNAGDAWLTELYLKDFIAKESEREVRLRDLRVVTLNELVGV